MRVGDLELIKNQFFWFR